MFIPNLNPTIVKCHLFNLCTHYIIWDNSRAFISLIILTAFIAFEHYTINLYLLFHILLF